MFFRRNRPSNPSFEQRVEAARSAGLTVSPQPDGRVRLARGACAALVEPAPEGARIIATGLLVGGELARLVDAGFQKFFVAPSGARVPAAAHQLKALHAFEEEIREWFGLPELYNESLGTVNASHEYDRLTGR
jgi:hypothetical protein